MTIKLLSIIGTRPQFIKSAIVSSEIDTFNKGKNKKKIQEIILNTSQHYDKNLSDIFIKDLFSLKPHINLKVKKNLSQNEMTTKIMNDIERHLIKESYDAVNLYGDTNSTLAAALVASKLNIPIIHIEAGLRSYNKKMPEEINRLITDHLSTLLFCPSNQSKTNLKKEGITDGVNVVGDVMLDINNKIKKTALSNFSRGKFGLKSEDFCILTIHRQETVDKKDNLLAILKAIDEISNDLDIFFPIHPRTKKMIDAFNLNKYLKNVITSAPVSYIDMIGLLNNCKLVFTDSGGLQKESIFNNKPCLILRDETEWVEIIKKGYGFLCGHDTDKILDEFNSIKSDQFKMTNKLYGDGFAAKKVVQKIFHYFS